jgi:hypothetical protein
MASVNVSSVSRTSNGVPRQKSTIKNTTSRRQVVIAAEVHDARLPGSD